MKYSLVKSIVFSILLVTLGGVIGFQVAQGNLLNSFPLQTRAILSNTTQPETHKNVDFAQFWEVWQILDEKYLDTAKLDPQKQVHGAIAGMTSALGDPYTLFLPPSDQKRSTEDLSGAFFGVGIELGYKDRTLTVIAPLKDSPAAKAGVQAGDFILKITDKGKNIEQDTADLSIIEAVEIIRGDRGKPITLTLFREGEPKAFDIEITRDEIIVPSVELSYQDKDGGKVAIITLSRFGGRTMTEWDGIVADIVSQPNIKGVILDVRNNPGGYLDGAIDIASEFIKDGVVVSQQGKFKTQKYTVSRSGKLTNFPVEVLINKGSASASEIVAGALRDRRQAKLIGENSFGKGTVQDALELNDGSGLHVTIGRWLLPNGEWIHDKGIPVNIEIKDNPETKDVDEALQRAVEEI